MMVFWVLVSVGLACSHALRKWHDWYLMTPEQYAELATLLEREAPGHGYFLARDYWVNGRATKKEVAALIATFRSSKTVKDRE